MDRILLDIVCILSNFINFWVAKIYGNIGTDTDIQISANIISRITIIYSVIINTTIP